MRKIIADFSPNTASTLNEVQKILLTNGLITQPVISMGQNDIYIGNFTFMNNGIIIESDPTTIPKPNYPKFYIYAYSDANPNSSVNFICTDKDYKFSNEVKVAYYDGLNFHVEDTIDLKDIIKYVRNVEKYRGFVSDEEIYYDTSAQELIIPPGKIISRIGNKSISNYTYVSLPLSYLFLTASNKNSRLSVRLFYNKLDKIDIEGIYHSPEFQLTQGYAIRSESVSYTLTGKSEPVDFRKAIFLTTSQDCVIYDSIENSVTTIRPLPGEIPDDVKCIYNERVFFVNYAQNLVKIKSYPPDFSENNSTYLELSTTEQMQYCFINPITKIIYLANQYGTKIYLYKISYDDNYSMKYQKKIIIDTNKTITSIKGGYNDRKIILFIKVSNELILYKIEIDEFDSWKIIPLMQVDTFNYIVKNSLDGDLYCCIVPYKTKDLIVLRNDELYINAWGILGAGTGDIIALNGLEIINNHIYLRVNYSSGQFLHEIIKTDKNQIYEDHISNPSWLTRSGAMLLTYNPSTISQIMPTYHRYLPRYYEDNILAIIYQDIGKYDSAINFNPVVKTNRISSEDDNFFIGKTQSKNLCLDLSLILDELYSNYPQSKIDLRISNGIYIDKQIILRGNTTFEGTFYINQDKIGNLDVFNAYTIGTAPISIISLQNNYYYLDVNLPSQTEINKIGPNDYFYGYNSSGNIVVKYKIIERVSKNRFLVFRELYTGDPSSYRLIIKNIKFKNSKIISAFTSTTSCRFCSTDVGIEFINSFISNSLIKGNEIIIKDSTSDRIQIDITKTERFEMESSKTVNTITPLITGSPIYPITIIMKNNDLFAYNTYDSVFNNFNFDNSNIKKIILENNNISDAINDNLYTYILKLTPQRGNIREGSVPALAITQQNFYRVVAKDKSSANTFGTPYYGTDGLLKAIQDANAGDIIVLNQGDFSFSTNTSVNITKPISIIGNKYREDSNYRLFPRIYRLTINWYPTTDFQHSVEFKHLHIAHTGITNGFLTLKGVANANWIHNINFIENIFENVCVFIIDSQSYALKISGIHMYDCYGQNAVLITNNPNNAADINMKEILMNNTRIYRSSSTADSPSFIYFYPCNLYISRVILNDCVAEVNGSGNYNTLIQLNSQANQSIPYMALNGCFIITIPTTYFPFYQIYTKNVVNIYITNCSFYSYGSNQNINRFRLENYRVCTCIGNNIMSCGNNYNFSTLYPSGLFSFFFAIGNNTSGKFLQGGGVNDYFVAIGNRHDVVLQSWYDSNNVSSQSIVTNNLYKT